MEAEPAAAVPPSADDGCQLVEWSTVAGEADFLISQCPDDEVVNSQLLRGLQTGRGLRLCTAKSLGVSAVDDLIFLRAPCKFVFSSVFVHFRPNLGNPSPSPSY
eukprot:TRINITY_DN38147_c0_g1_i3.p1 TRINITY_DN38147_c0_g1~~TRINITY_DN38147_c0_g1_i3.p1  ORF type:complete len:104 (+),score=5.95 TRINITY_DN38147_c0_g1_i3:78-389(+)